MQLEEKIYIVIEKKKRERAPRLLHPALFGWRILLDDDRSWLVAESKVAEDYVH